VRVPLRHPRASARGRGALHRRQPGAPAQPGRDLRQGGERHHEAVLAGAADAAAQAPRGGGARQPGEFEPISWDEAFDILATRLARIRATDPKKFALFTGRDQMQALTGLFARQFGTPNYAAHGGFCSVNMAAGMIYTIGGSFWEFGGPDLERARLFVMLGTAEDHHSNPLKIALAKFKRGGGRFVSVNPVRTGYSAIADEWVPIRPGTDGAFLLAVLHELIALGLYDRDFVARYTNGGHLVVCDEGSPREGLLGAHAGCGGERHRLAAGAVVVGPALRPRRPHACRRGRPVPLRRVPARRWHPRQACLPASRRSDERIHAGVGRGDHGDRRRHHPAPGARNGRHGARPENRAADRRGPIRWGREHPIPSPATRSLSTQCAALQRTPTAFTRCARWPS
jgi:hypothetical protein